MKRIISAVLLAVMLLSSTSFAVAAEPIILIAPRPKAAAEEVFLKSLKTSNDPQNYMEIKIEDNTLRFSALVNNPDVKLIVVDWLGKYVAAKLVDGLKSVLKFDLNEINGDSFELCIYTSKGEKEEFLSAFYGTDIVLKKDENGEWGIALNKEVFEENSSLSGSWVLESEHLSLDVPERIVKAAETVTLNIETDYDKARAIHKWVADTFYYDVDFAQGIKNETNVAAQDVYDKGVAVCEGYANLTVALLRAVKIPAFVVKGYALNEYNAAAKFEDTKNLDPNHAWVEAFVDGKWIAMDPTWDSVNKIINGEKESATRNFYRYFDMSIEMLSSTHKIMERPVVFKNGVDTWALDESKEAYKLSLVTDACRENMKESITRREFCELLINMLTVKLSKSVDEIIEAKSLVLDDGIFNDTTDKNVLVATALGIVNGKGEGRFDPDGIIKRQEAAAMLQRAAKNVLGVTSANSEPVTFADENEFQPWGADAIRFVSASSAKDGSRVMGGVGNNLFSPNSLYTKQQSVLTIYRLYTAY